MTESDDRRTEESKRYAEARLREHLRQRGLTLLEPVWSVDQDGYHVMHVLIEGRSKPLKELFGEALFEDKDTNHQIDLQTREFARLIAPGDRTS